MEWYGEYDHDGASCRHCIRKRSTRLKSSAIVPSVSLMYNGDCSWQCRDMSADVAMESEVGRCSIIMKSEHCEQMNDVNMLLMREYIIL